MRPKNQKLMDDLVEYIDSFYREYGCSPSIRTLADRSGISKSTVQRYLVELSSMNRIRYNGKIIETSRSAKMDSGKNYAPISGSIPCGRPETEEEQIDTYVALPSEIFGTRDLYILRASGDSMINAGIEDGDLVVLCRQTHAAVGDMVAALTERGSTLKRYIGADPKTGKAVLHPENDTMEDWLVSQFIVQGVVQNIIKTVKPVY